MNDSSAKTLGYAPSERVDDTRSGISLTKCVVTVCPGNRYRGMALRPEPKFGPGMSLGVGCSNGGSRYCADSRLPGCPPGRVACDVDHTSVSQSSTLPSPSTPALILMTIAEPYGSHWCSWARVYWSFTGMPGTAAAKRAASAAASSAMLWP